MNDIEPFQAGPISVKDIGFINPSEISDRGLDGYIDAVFCVNTVYDGEGGKSFLMKDDYPAVYYKGTPYGIRDCDGVHSHLSTDGNKYFQLSDGLMYYCVVEKIKGSTATNSVLARIASAGSADMVEPTRGYEIVDLQLLCSTPLAGTKGKVSQFHTGIVDAIDDFEGKPAFSIDKVKGDEGNDELYMYVPKKYSCSYKGLVCPIEEATEDGWYGMTQRVALDENSTYYFWFERSEDFGYTAHVGTEYPDDGIGVMEILRTEENGSYVQIHSGSISMSDLGLMQVITEPFKIDISANRKGTTVSEFDKKCYICIPNSMTNPSFVYGNDVVTVETSGDFTKVAGTDLYEIKANKTGPIVLYVYLDNSLVKAKLCFFGESKPDGVFHDYPIGYITDEAYSTGPRFIPGAIIQKTSGIIAMDRPGGGTFCGRAFKSSTGIDVVFTNCKFKYNGSLVDMGANNFVSGLKSGDRVFLKCYVNSASGATLVSYSGESYPSEEYARYELLGYVEENGETGIPEYISSRALLELGLPFKGGSDTNMLVTKDEGSEQYKLDIYYK